ncbi:EF-hand domain-containing protein [Nocardia huaxiensis]|uniref:EF-hand domain-containing protein n=1 Tax=Nocardia huaxiensis TaxID=2755382 RepID=A0A7D6VAI8_9NOCA|nr:EF-hand domain-containing protein [Nocardia huaxiensis]QLY31761.1 EF-hand domain-containing protein [Nocardia huaxiensis]UFS95322.1 EF-hand domain-containing protein [Nocardia huaxiensis]
MPANDPADTFDLWDRDGDGQISAEDILLGIRALGLEIDEEAVSRLVAAADTDGDFLISRAEFDAARLGRDPEITDPDAAFDTFDTNRNELIELNELESLLRTCPALTDESAESLLTAADTDCDGYLSRAEFAALLAHLAR